MSSSDSRHDRPEAHAWRRLARNAGLQTESILSTVRDRFDARFRPDRPVQVIGYRGHANDDRATVSCRVLRYSKQPNDNPEALWELLQASYRRFETDELAGARVRLTLADQNHEATTDDEGYAHFDFAPPTDQLGTLSAQLSLPDIDGSRDDEVQIVRASPAARFGIVSDVDDTVLVTEATSLLRMMRLTLLSSSASRVAFDGVAPFYQALVAGGNPLFYVSSSPWNLYEFLDDFMAARGLPSGPLLLRDFGLDSDKLIAGPHERHKFGAISSVLERHADLPFVLIGDSGQHDPEIYRRIVEAYPDRIRAIYIRDVSEDARDAAVRDHVAALEAQGVPMLLVPDTLAAARHAATLGLIDEAALPGIGEGVEADRAPNAAVDDQPELAAAEVASNGQPGERGEGDERGEG